MHFSWAVHKLSQCLCITSSKHRTPHSDKWQYSYQSYVTKHTLQNISCEISNLCQVFKIWFFLLKSRTSWWYPWVFSLKTYYLFWNKAFLKNIFIRKKFGQLSLYTFHSTVLQVWITVKVSISAGFKCLKLSFKALPLSLPWFPLCPLSSAVNCFSIVFRK